MKPMKKHPVAFFSKLFIAFLISLPLLLPGCKKETMRMSKRQQRMLRQI
jgi:hypothetical protein